MDINLTTATGKASKKVVEISDAVIGCDYNEPLIHQVVTAYMAGARAGTRAQKTRSQVSGGGIKPWRQKGTGRARAGTIRSPLWRSGGTTFAAVPVDHSQKVNKKMYRGAIRSILSELLRKERLVVVDSLSIEAPKTKDLLAKMKALGLDNALIVTEGLDENVALSARNLYHYSVLTVEHVDPVSLIAHDKVLITAAALKMIEEKLA